MFRLSPNAMAPGYGLAENVCLATFQQDYRTLKLDYEAYQKNCAVLVTEEKRRRTGQRDCQCRCTGQRLNLVIANPKTKKPYPDLHIGEIFISGDSVANGYWAPERKC